MGVVPARPCASALLLFVLLSPLASFLGLPLSLVESGVTIGSSETRGVRRVATVGVYGFTIDGFLEALREADVRLLLDVRQRRGVRGAQYAWANAVRLQAALARAGVPAGSQITKRVPAAELSTRTEPPDSVTKPFTIASPRPLPLTRRLWSAAR